MSTPKRTQPYRLDVKKEETVQICICGQTDSPPLCDCSHPDHTDPFEFTPEKDETLTICGCGRSDALPWCDGSHTEC
ncbi:MAG: CDGSH iron-sulfur domain-containing protein [Magnetococcales bacterium]|nr:CDGSH iron-sulfur domain-containing protein [Magnetococcales bacterium]